MENAEVVPEFSSPTEVAQYVLYLEERVAELEADAEFDGMCSGCAYSQGFDDGFEFQASQDGAPELEQ